MLGLPLQDSLQQGWTYTCFAIFNAYSQVMWKQLVWPIFKRLQTLNGPNIIKYHQISRGNLGQEKQIQSVRWMLANRLSTAASMSLSLCILSPSLNFLWGFRLQQPCLYQLPRMRWCQTLLAPHHSAGWPVILKCNSTKSATVRSTVPMR